MKSLILLLVFAVLSCGRPGDRYDSSTYRLPWPSATGEIALQDVEIRTLRDPGSFSGDVANIWVEPGDGGSGLAGSEPQGRYVRSRSGVLIPADYTTMQAVTAYAHIERLRDLDSEVGVASVLSWPLSLGVEVNVMSYGQRATNNAIYDAKLDSLLLVPYNKGGLPIALNPGVLAHEHFHFLFQRLVMSHVRDVATQTSCSGGVVAAAPASPASKAPVPTATAADEEASVPTLAESFGEDGSLQFGVDRVEKTAAAIPARVYNSYLLRGLNEGFADFYGWVYSGDNSFLAKSLPEQDEMRRLDSDSGRLPSERLLRRLLVDNFHPEAILPESVRSHNAYSLGSTYARYLRRLVDDYVSSGRSASEARLLVVRAMIATLPDIAAKMEVGYEKEFVSPNFVLSKLLTHLPPLTSAVCVSLDDVHAPETDYARPASCDVFKSVPAAKVEREAPQRDAKFVKPFKAQAPAAKPAVAPSAGAAPKAGAK